jgi:hypothetical protein
MIELFFNLDTTHASEPSKKLLRSAVNASSKTKSKYVLAPVCIICKKEKYFVTDTVSKRIYW